MISTVRLEAEGKTLKEVVGDLDDAVKRLGPAFDHLTIHDEHYERVHATCFKGRRVFRVGEKGSAPVYRIGSGGGGGTAGTGVVSFSANG